MSDRLTELQRQRALIQGHLAWLDQEISRERSTPYIGSSLTPQLHTPLPPTPSSAEENADAIIAEFSADPKNEIQNVRRGCFIAFGAALFLLGLFVCALYLYMRSKH